MRGGAEELYHLHFMSNRLPLLSLSLSFIHIPLLPFVIFFFYSELCPLAFLYLFLLYSFLPFGFFRFVLSCLLNFKRNPWIHSCLYKTSYRRKAHLDILRLKQSLQISVLLSFSKQTINQKKKRRTPKREVRQEENSMARYLYVEASLSLSELIADVSSE